MACHVVAFDGLTTPLLWASYHIRNIEGCACAGMPGTFSPTPISKETAS